MVPLVVSDGETPVVVDPEVDGLTPEVDGLTPEVDGLTPEVDGLTPEVEGATPEVEDWSVPVDPDVEATPEEVDDPVVDASVVWAPCPPACLSVMILAD